VTEQDLNVSTVQEGTKMVVLMMSSYVVVGLGGRTSQRVNHQNGAKLLLTRMVWEGIGSKSLVLDLNHLERVENEELYRLVCLE
jgi:hypothetical protein